MIKRLSTEKPRYPLIDGQRPKLAPARDFKIEESRRHTIAQFNRWGRIAGISLGFAIASLLGYGTYRYFQDSQDSKEVPEISSSPNSDRDSAHDSENVLDHLDREFDEELAAQATKKAGQQRPQAQR